ncbi:MAG TPA: hypothetical protein VMF52_14870 [Steroidobacteraceae bacterium]|nr:hypothetical protein [Steroidobacteraceae bacterium]
MSTSRLGRARTQSLCGTARGIASRQSVSEQRGVKRRPCRHAAIWSCQKSEICSRRMALHRALPHAR